MNLKFLSITTFILLSTAYFVYLNDTHRSTDLAVGSYFIKGLDVEKIQKIVLNIDKEKKFVFIRDGGQFLIESHKSYPASTKKINELLYKLGNLQIKEKLVSSPSISDQKKYRVSSDLRKYHVEIYDSENKKTQSLYIGQGHKNKKYYLYKENGKALYSALGRLWLDSSYKDYVDLNLMDLEKDKVHKIELAGQQKFEILKNEDGQFVVSDEKKDIKPEKIDDYVAGLGRVHFDDFFRGDEPDLLGVQFTQELNIKLKNNVQYQLRVGKAKKDGQYFVKARAMAQELPNQVVVKSDASQEELKGVENLIKAREVAERFNLLRGSWVYKVDESSFKQLVKSVKEFL